MRLLWNVAIGISWSTLNFCVFLSWTGEQLDMPTRGLLSHVSVATRSRTVFPPGEVSLERETALLVSTQSTEPSGRVFNVDDFRESLKNLFVISLGERSSSLRMMSSLETWVSTLVAMGDEFAFRMLQTMTLSPCRERRVRACELFGRSERSSEAPGHRSGLAKNDLLHAG